MNSETNRYALLVLARSGGLLKILVFLYLFASRVVAQPLPQAQNNSAEKTLAQAKSITHGLAFFHGKKAGLLTDQGQKQSIELFRRLLPDGVIETKFIRDGTGAKLIEYKLRNGRYQLIRDSVRDYLAKLEYEDNQVELSLAATPGQHYEYKMLRPEMVGTNDCLVVARIATPDFVQSLKDAYYPGYATNTILGDPGKFIRSEICTYIRKVDGVVIGEVKKNNSGEVLDDYLYSEVRINEAVPDSEFVLPKMPSVTVTNMAQLMAGVSKAKHAPRNPGKRAALLGFIAISLGGLGFLLYKNFSKG